MSNRRRLVVLFGCLSVGCNSGALSPARLDLTSIDDAGKPQRHYATFEQASYRRSSGGLVELVLQSEQPSQVDPTQTITQLVYIKSHWFPIPGQTYMEATQINAELQYAMLTPPTGVRYDGAAFVSYKLGKGSGDLKGVLESGTMSPQYRMGNATEPFGPSRLVGKFVAKENPREVVRVVQLLETQFKEKLAAAGR